MDRRNITQNTTRNHWLVEISLKIDGLSRFSVEISLKTFFCQNDFKIENFIRNRWFVEVLLKIYGLLEFNSKSILNRNISKNRLWIEISLQIELRSKFRCMSNFDLK